MILDEIIAHKKTELPLNKTFSDLMPSRRSLKTYLKGKHNIIAEIKRKSPSQGEIRKIDREKIAFIYNRYANAISVLTDKKYFGGSLEDLEVVSKITNIPILRKDFIFHKSQIGESRKYGADAILLIASILSQEEINEFIDTAKIYNMDCLVEVHTKKELEKVLKTNAEIIGINNRNLKDFSISLEVTQNLKQYIPKDIIIVSESGIFTRSDIEEIDTNAVLIGTSLMKATDIEEKLTLLRRPKVKICGITTKEDALTTIDSGADYIGFNFYEKSPRYISPKKAKEIIEILPNKVSSVGIFVNESKEKVKDILDCTGLDILQFHGDESPEYCQSFTSPIIKAFHVSDTIPSIQEYNVFGYLFDTFDPKLYGGTGRCFQWNKVENIEKKLFLSGGLTCENIKELTYDPYSIDVCSGVEQEKGKKDPYKVHTFIRRAKDRTRFGRFGGQFIPETLMPAISELEKAYLYYKNDRNFQHHLSQYLKHYAGRPTPLYFAQNLSRRVGCKIYLKREDLLHGGAHKTNNVLGQALLAKAMKKTRIIAETGAGQHGIAVAMIGALFQIPTTIYMGIEDTQRQEMNVKRMKLCGAKVHPVEISKGKGTLKDAISEALRDWTTNVHNTYYMLGSVAGPHPYPSIVRDFQKIIGEETRKQIQEREGRLPDKVVACIGGGSNAIGIFNAFLKDKEVNLIGVEAGGDGEKHGATLSYGTEGVFQGAATYILQDSDGQIQEAKSIAPGLDYPGVGPQHAFLKATNRAQYASMNDKQALEAFKILSQEEGIIPALESSHAVAYILAKKFPKDHIVIINLSGRGDKDLTSVESSNESI